MISARARRRCLARPESTLGLLLDIASAALILVAMGVFAAGCVLGLVAIVLVVGAVVIVGCVL